MKEGNFFSFRQKKTSFKKLNSFFRIETNKQTESESLKKRMKVLSEARNLKKIVVVKKQNPNCVQQQQTSVCDFSHPIVIHTTIIIIII